MPSRPCSGTASELADLVGAEPFPAADVKASKGKLQVLLLAAKPTAAARKAVLAHSTGEDRLAFGERELFWLPSGGISDSDLDLRGDREGAADRRRCGRTGRSSASWPSSSTDAEVDYRW